VGMGNTVDNDNAKEFPEGSFVMIPAHTNHYSFTKEETEVQVSGVGPWGMKMPNTSPDSTPNTSKNPS